MDHPYNRGMVYRGNPMAKIAVVGAAPSDSETEKGVPLVGMVGREFEKWMAAINIDTQREVFITNVIQCMPPKVILNRKKKLPGILRRMRPMRALARGVCASCARCLISRP